MSTQQTYNDAEASLVIVFVFIVVTVASDIILLCILHVASLQIPKPNQYDHVNEQLDKGCLFRRKYPSFYFIDTAQNNDDDNIDSDTDMDDEKEETQALIESTELSYFGTNTESIWDKIFKHRTFLEYLSLSLQFWSLCCGIISIYLSFVFYMNVILEYIIVCINDGISSYNIIGLLSIFFLIECIFWFIRRQLETLFILFRNTLDIYNINFIKCWRSFNLFSCIFFSIWIAIDDNFIPFSDILFWQFFLYFMVIRGLLFQLLYIIITMIQSMLMIWCKVCCLYKEQINIFQLILAIDSKKEIKINQNYLINTKDCPRWLQFLFIVFIFVCIALFILLYLINDDELFRFAAISTLLYYVITVFERGKYNALYLLWINRYHHEYFKELVAVENILNKYQDQDQDVIHNAEITPAESQLSINMKDIKFHHHQQNTNGTMFIHNDADIPLIEKILNQNNDNDDDNLSMEICKINYKTFWRKVHYDYKKNDYFGCNKYCHCAQDCAGWIIIILFIILLIIISYLFIIQSNQTPGYVFNINNDSILPTTYPICDFNLKQNTYLSMMDLTYLSIIAYSTGSKQNINKQFRTWFGNNYNESWDVNSLSLHQNPSFYHIYNTEYNFNVIGIRGTVDKTDIEEDIGLWSEIATFQLFSWLIPLTNVLPMGFKREFIKLSSIPEDIIAPSVRNRYDKPIYDYIKNNIINNDEYNDSLIITLGHSLGGGTAQIVSARLYNNGYGDNNNIISFSLSSPGTLHSSKKFGFSVESLDKTSITILPRRDIVGMVDEHGGIVQTIECNTKDVFSCHSAQTSFCELCQQCSNNQLTRNISFAECVCVHQNEWSKCY